MSKPAAPGPDADVCVWCGEITWGRDVDGVFWASFTNIFSRHEMHESCYFEHGDWPCTCENPHKLATLDPACPLHGAAAGAEQILRDTPPIHKEESNDAE